MSIWWLVPFYVWVIVKTYHNSEVCTQIQLADISSLTSSLDLVTTKNYWFFFLCQRPRRVGAKFSGEDIKADEHIQPQLSFDYDGKRDR